ncbi:MAG: hypothetical protein L3J59_13545 [Methylococcaceae bacterium]|nr:hypothetical protein [Methylococcaceae bacterium]
MNTSTSEGNAGNIVVHAKKVFLSDTGPIKDKLGTQIASTSPTGTGNSGNITINTDQLNIQDYAIIKTNTGGFGDAGSITIDTDHLEMRNGGKIEGTTLEDAGNAGHINIDAKTMLLSGDDSRDIPGQVTTINTQSYNNNSDSLAGQIDIKVEEIEIRDGATITVGSKGQSSGPGGSIKINADQIYAHNGAEITSTTLGLRQGGGIELEAKEIVLSGEDTMFQAATASIKKAGDLSIESDSLILHNGAEINTNTLNYGRGGDLTISVNTLEMNNKASIETNTFAGGQGGNLTVDAKTILLTGGNTMLSSQSFFGSGNAGNLTVTADQIKLKDLAAFNAATSGLGKGGDITVEAKTIFLSNSSFITDSEDSSVGDAGDLTVTADHLVLEENAVIKSDTRSQGIDSYIKSLDDLAASPGIQKSFIDSLTPHIEEHHNNIGNAGNVTINADQLEIKNDSLISAITVGKGQGGNLNVTAHSIFITANNSEYLTGLSTQSRSEEDNAGDAGNIFVNTNYLEVHSGAEISTGTKGSGHGGSLTIDANTILLSGDDSDYFTGIKSEASNNNSGNAGSLTVTARNRLDIRDNAGISSNIFGTGQGGLMQINANNIKLDNATISSASNFSGYIPEDSDLAKSGKIDITVNDTLSLKNNSFISVKTKKANAGEINITSGNVLYAADSSITTSVANGKGNGGNININSSIVSLDKSEIIAQAKKGYGGIINFSGFLFKSPSSKIDATSETNRDGKVIKLKPETNISGNIAVLPESLLNVSQHLSERCSSRSGVQANSFVVKNRGGVPLRPSDLSPSTYMDISPYSESKNSFLGNETSLSLAKTTFANVLNQQSNCYF